MIKDFHLYFSLANAWTIVTYLQPGFLPIAMSLGMMVVSVFAAYKEGRK